MSGFSTLMFIFGICLFLTGFYCYTGHKIFLLTGRASFQNLSKEEWENIGKWTMIVSTLPFILSFIGLFFE